LRSIPWIKVVRQVFFCLMEKRRGYSVPAPALKR
jgi:hypothetical protein